MAFSDNFKRIASFNSVNSCEFISLFNDAILDTVKTDASKPHAQTFAPSSSYCDRKIWFRFRGVNPDTPVSADSYSEFIKAIGTACHTWIQSLLSSKLGKDWIDVEDYLKETKVPYEYLCTKDGYETHVEVKDPPFRYSVDGLVRIKDKLYIIEIKSLDYNAFDEIYEPRAKDVAQIESYQSLLYIEDVMYVYVNRVTGQIKCFEYHNPNLSYDKLVARCNEIRDMANRRIAPSKVDDKNYCAMCEYKKKCKDW